MKILIVEDDFASRKLMENLLKEFGDYDSVVDGEEALQAFRISLEDKTPYDLICLDIMLPKLDGQTVLREVRRIEEERGILGLDGAKVIMTTALGDAVNVMTAFRSQCEGYIQKPITKEKLVSMMLDLGLLAH
ncbi:response regulator [Sediminispirochaeta smaragdinae]|jgi:two-component system chemotaxis response regulator CheY|uniref:Response regulator receiver protein n=1 Tax=Sediminispirochaeta smaragdinae (strain DSM 11293 / JCM 15392 / SEBR 4228) TaxID=573413 RepID=E1R3P0_SEDSS|nr:response regulator [Sediminispirochaeta smaragdinae]ADK82011.1 response regulator receiver protein [Sediminispirochaeta smaragdinae DSM 11293]